MDNPRQNPPRVRIIANDRVWMEGAAGEQLAATATRMPACCAAVGMPDLHPGPGIPIGAAFALRETVRPQLVGSDAGCGALFVGLGKVKRRSNLARRLRAEFEDAEFADELFRELPHALSLGELLDRVCTEGPRALLGLGLPAIAEELAERVAEDTLPASRLFADGLFARALGSIGGGNHFAEVTEVEKVIDKEEAARLGLASGSLGLLIHSGSRGLGKALADKWGARVLKGADLEQYLGELAAAIRFARVNRVLLAWRLLRALGVSRADKIACAIDVVHNQVRSEEILSEPGYVHRKGCAPAPEGALVAVLGSRGTPSWLVRGTGNPEGLSSVAHGAGRKMQRGEAREKIRHRYRRKELDRAGSVICDDKKLLYEEHPDAYKDIEPVISSLEEAGMAERVLSLQPVFTIKK